MKTGSVDLPLHPGKCPAWLFKRMRPLTKAISQIIIDNYGTRALLARISDPMFFQALSCVIAFDWHSSGVTTTTCGAIKEALTEDMGLVACGGKGKTSRKTPEEINRFGESFSLSDSRISQLQKSSRLSAKVDSSAVQDGYDLYHHSFLFDEKGNWAVVQQGMNAANRYARRYHWFNEQQFVDDPKTKIAGSKEKEVLNLVSGESEDTRKASVDLVKDNPYRLRKYFDGQTTLFDEEHHSFPKRHEILTNDLTKQDWQMLHHAYELQPGNYEELVALKGMGGRKLRALALVSKLVHGTKLDWKDPVKYSFAHGGKDGIPYPVDKQTYDHSIEFLRDVINEMNANEKQNALRRLASVC